MEVVQEAFDGFLEAAREYLRKANGDVGIAIDAARRDYEKDREEYSERVIARSLEIQIRFIKYAKRTGWTGSDRVSEE
ncbi:MAG: hypothetical protein IJW30_04135 [Clostridia bacterium]|nr:hypothetical protein [Clostridia bacterium]